MRLRKLKEAELILAIKKDFSKSKEDIILGIGDDAAVVKPGRIPLLITKDLLIEDVDFMRRLHPAFFVGRKSLNVNLSDMAAMGGRPKFALLGLGLPSHLETAWIEDFFSGFKSAATREKVTLVGGDISESIKIVVSVTVIGQGKNVIRRHGAQASDYLFVSGYLGDAKLGFLLMKKGFKLGEDRRADPILRAFLDPRPQIGLGCELSRQKIASSMIDISDGLSSDLSHLCQESQVGAEIYLENLPLSRRMRALGKNALDLALHGGEDFQLLFSVPPEKLKLVSKLQKRHKITLIGKMLRHRGIFVIDRLGKKRLLEIKGFEHFVSS